MNDFSAIIILILGGFAFCYIAVASHMLDILKLKGYGEQKYKSVKALMFWCSIFGSGIFVFMYIMALPDLTQNLQLYDLIESLNNKEVNSNSVD